MPWMLLWVTRVTHVLYMMCSWLLELALFRSGAFFTIQVENNLDLLHVSSACVCVCVSNHAISMEVETFFPV